jgi:hypothetical protein
MKKCSKKPKNNIISERMNKIKPNLNFYEQLMYDTLPIPLKYI